MLCLGSTRDKPPAPELSVNIYNTNKYKQLPFKSNCKALEDYTTFVDLINKARKAGYKDYITVAIKQAKQMGLMVDYLSRKSKEVSNMIFGEYNYERDIKVQREEAYEDGLEDGLEQGAYQNKFEKDYLESSCQLSPFTCKLYFLYITTSQSPSYTITFTS